MSSNSELDILKEKIDNYHPIVKIVFNILNDNNKVFLMKRLGNYTLNDMSSGSFLIGDDKINLLVEFIEEMQQSFNNKTPVNFKIGKIEKHKLEDFNDKIINARPLNNSNIQELMQVLPYYITPDVFISTSLKDYLPKNNQIHKSLFSKIGMAQEPDPVVPKSVNVEKIIVSALENAPINKAYLEEADIIKKVFAMFAEKNSFYKKHVSQNQMIQSLVNYTHKRFEVFEKLKDKNLEEGLFKSIKEIIPKEHWKDVTHHLPSYPKKNVDNKSLFEIPDIVTIQTNISKEIIYNKYDDINTEVELDRMISTIVEVINTTKPKDIQTIIVKNKANDNYASLFISGKNVNKDFVIKVLQGLESLMEDYKELDMANLPLFQSQWDESRECLKKLSHSFWINLKIEEVKESSPERKKVRKI